MTLQGVRSPSMWRVHKAADDDGNVWLTLQHPTPLKLVRERVTDVLSSPDTDEMLTFVQLVPGIETPFEVQKEFETWVAQGDTEAPYLDVAGRNARLVWRGRRCLAYSTPQAAEDCLAAAAMFSHLHSTLSAEEGRMERAWPSLMNDAALTHDVRLANSLRDQGRVNDMTRQFQTARILVSRMDIALQRPEPTTPPAVKRLFSELALQADLASRIRLLDDAVEVGEDLYERANDRLIEHRNYLVEIWIEAAILLAILAELAVLVFDFFSK